jgi:hypothetical protein
MLRTNDRMLIPYANLDMYIVLIPYNIRIDVTDGFGRLRPSLPNKLIVTKTQRQNKHEPKHSQLRIELALSL